MKLEYHEYANLFPMMTDEELSKLVNDMRENGYDETAPIITYHGKILDGRNRYKASEIAGVAPVFVQYDGEDALTFVIRHNLNRRHLNESQRAVIAGRLETIKHGDNRYTVSRDANLHIYRKDAAEMLNVSPRTVATVKAVERAAPEFIEKIERGEMTAHEAQKTIKAKERTEKREELAQTGAKVKPSDRWNVYHADIQSWNAPRKYDFIITDPPYPKEYLHLYEVLAYQAVKWLKPGGLVIAMAGQSYLDEVYAAMSKHLQYYWTASYLTPGASASLRQKQVNTQWKPLLVYGMREDRYTGKIFNDVFTSGENDKDNHKWGQSISGMCDIVSRICLPGQYILDPFCGAGTTGIAALRHGCFFDGLELLEENVNISKARLHDETAKR